MFFFLCSQSISNWISLVPGLPLPTRASPTPSPPSPTRAPRRLLPRPLPPLPLLPLSVPTVRVAAVDLQHHGAKMPRLNPRGLSSTLTHLFLQRLAKDEHINLKMALKPEKSYFFYRSYMPRNCTDFLFFFSRPHHFTGSLRSAILERVRLMQLTLPWGTPLTPRSLLRANPGHTPPRQCS